MDERSRNVSYQFGSFRVDMAKRLVLRGDSPLPLTSKAFDTLAVLIADRGKTVSKAELMNAVWGETAVEENNLTQQISTLRKALGERARDHKFIVTVPGRGYRFVAAVNELPNGSAAAAKGTGPTPPGNSGAFGLVNGAASDRSKRFDRGSLFGGGLAIVYVLVVCLSAFLSGGQNSRSAVEQRSVAVLPFRSLGGGDEPLGIGIRDTLRAKLGSLKDVTVRPGSPNTIGHDPLEAGRQLHADVVLAGSIQRELDRIRVAVEMVDVSGERIVWGKTFDESPSKLFELQDSIANEVVRALRKSEAPGARLDAPSETSDPPGSLSNELTRNIIEAARATFAVAV